MKTGKRSLPQPEKLSSRRGASWAAVRPMQPIRCSTLGRSSESLAFAHQGKRLRSEVDAANQLDGWLAGLESGRAGADRSDLDRAAQILGRWLAADDVAKSVLSANAASRQRTIVLGAAIAWGVLAIVLAFTVHLSWLLGLVASGGLVAWALWPSQKESLLDLRPSIESEFARQAVTSPSDWSAESVRMRLGEMQKEAREAAFEQVRAARWSDLKPHLLEARQRLEAYQSSWRSVCATRGLPRICSTQAKRR